MTPKQIEGLRELRDLLKPRHPSREHLAYVIQNWKRLNRLSDLITQVLQYMQDLERETIAGGRVGGLKSAIAQRDARIAELQLMYERLATASTLPFPPCGHGRDVRNCLRCITTWLNRAQAQSPNDDDEAAT